MTMLHSDLRKFNVPEDVIDAAKTVGMDAEKLGQLVVQHSVEAVRDFLDWLKGKVPVGL